MALTGISRGFLVFRCKLVVSESQMRTGALVAERMRVAALAARDCDVPVNDHETFRILSEEPLNGTPEPYATPASNLTLALEANEQVLLSLPPAYLRTRST